MTRALVSVRSPHGTRDFELPTTATAAEIAGWVGRVWGVAVPAGGLRLRLEGSPVPLAGNATLDEAGVSDGAMLVLEPAVMSGRPADVMPPSAWLVSASGRKYALASGQNWIGRSADGASAAEQGLAVDLALEPESLTVSKQHAYVTPLKGGWYLVCLPTTLNPTLVNGKAIRPGEAYPLNDGDQVLLGALKLNFRRS